MWKTGLAVSSHRDRVEAVAQVPVQMARFTFDLQDGAYTCLATLPGMSALYDEVTQSRSNIDLMV